MGRGKFFQHVHCGRAGLCFAAPCRRLEIQLVEQNLRELRRRIDVEFFARQFPDFFLQAADLFLHRLRHGIERLRIHANSRALHARQTERPSLPAAEISIDEMRAPNPSASRSPASRFSHTANGRSAGSFSTYSRNSAALES